MRTEAIQTWPALIVQVSLLELLFTSCWAAEERRGGGGGVRAERQLSVTKPPCGAEF